tara:strand:- start:375 stop:587 length:213 start_codon:yes stop_codon:yes gene_type:complete
MPDLKNPHQALAAALVISVVATDQDRVIAAVNQAEQIASMLDDKDFQLVKDVCEICLTMLGEGEDSVIDR